MKLGYVMANDKRERDQRRTTIIKNGQIRMREHLFDSRTKERANGYRERDNAEL